MQSPKFTGWAQAWHNDSNSKHRLHAIRSFGRAMTDPVMWKQSWEDAGGTSGILYLLSLASVTEVKAFCNAIKCSGRPGGKSSEREKVVDELVMALLPQHYPATVLRTHDRRPIQRFFSRMLRGCSSGFVERILDEQDESNPLFQNLRLDRLLLAHQDMLKRRLSNYMIHDGPPISQSEIVICFKQFVFRVPALPGTQPNMSAAMQFALELLQARVTLECTAQRWPRNISELVVLMSIYNRLRKRSRLADRIPLIKLGLQLIELKPDLALSTDAGLLFTAILPLWKRDPGQYEDLLSQSISLGLRESGTALPLIATRWKEDPDKYEHLLVQCLRQGLGGSAQNIANGYLATISGIPKKELSSILRWRLLRLYCQHVPQKGIDIETSSDFKCLAKQAWPFELVEKLESDHAVLFLNALSKINPSFEFLQGPRNRKSIYLPSPTPRKNFNVELLLTAYNRGDPDVQQRARDEVDKLRQMAAAEREPVRRSRLAVAAAHYAIATGDLNVYRETVSWQQRFNRDDFTAKMLYAPDFFLTEEGVALLSGFTLSPTDDTTLSTIRHDLAIANETLKTLSEVRLSATREPAYIIKIWEAFESLYTCVYKERVSRAKKFELQPLESKLDLFRIIWEGTMDLACSIGSDFMRQVSQPIRELVQGFSGLSLIIASEILLDTASRWQKEKGGSKDQATLAAVMGRLSCDVVSYVSQCDTPMLACDLIRRTIIENPEASSWHRKFLSIQYMKKLPAEAAKTMLLSFATAIGEKLEEQSYVKVGDTDPPRHAPPQSLIKVTTVKYLAQLLQQDANFIAPDTAAEVLIELFKSATHPHIRLATVESLLNILNTILNDDGERWRSNPMVGKILGILDNVTSIAGNLNEDHPVDTTDWDEAKQTVTTFITPTPVHTIPPLFGMVLKTATREKRFSNLGKLRRELFSRLVVPTLRCSQEEHRRWFSLFLAKQGSSLNVNLLPRVPIATQVWGYMLQHQGDLLPSEIIDEYYQYVAFRLRMPKSTTDFNKSLKSDENISGDKSVIHWLCIFGAIWPDNFRIEISPVLDLIMSPIEKASSMTDLLSVVVRLASVLLDDYEHHRGQWSTFMAMLGPVRLTADAQDDGGDNHEMKVKKSWAYWCETTASLAQGLITLLEQKAASSADRDNTILPSTFPLRLWCVPYPCPYPRTLPQDQAFHDLAVALDRSLSSFLESNEGDMVLWASLADTTYTRLDSIYNSTIQRLSLAVHVGDLDLEPEKSSVGVVQLIKVTLALKFIDSVSGRRALWKPISAKDLTPEKLQVGELVKRLRVVMDRWGQRGAKGKQAYARDTILRWKDSNETVWKDICSWDPQGENGSHNS